MKILAVIPARYESSRFRGKPLADLCGKPMIWWVYHNCKQVKEFSDVYVATDDKKIYNACLELNMKAMMTSSRHKTGTDRVGEVAQMIEADYYVNVQGDEPLLGSDVIREAIAPILNGEKYDVINLMEKITNPIDAINYTVPKVITNRENIGIYLTRAAAPMPKGTIEYDLYKQVCVYCFTPQSLQFFCRYGDDYGKAKTEAVEDIEILRFIENGYKVKYVEVCSNSVAVDTYNDLKRVERIMKERIEKDCEK